MANIITDFTVNGKNSNDFIHTELKLPYEYLIIMKNRQALASLAN